MYIKLAAEILLLVAIIILLVNAFTITDNDITISLLSPEQWKKSKNKRVISSFAALIFSEISFLMLSGIVIKIFSLLIVLVSFIELSKVGVVFRNALWVRSLQEKGKK